MLIPNHPDDDRLAALASRESDATADTTLTAHVSSCDRCTKLVNELGALRAALSELPDVAPSRPLRLLPAVESASPGAADRLGGWARRFFAPVLASGAALALAGTIGTAAPVLQGQQATGGAADGASASVARILAEPAPAASSAEEEFAASEDPAEDAAAGEAGSEPAAAAAAPSDEASRSLVEGAAGDVTQPSAESAAPSAGTGVGTLGLDDGRESAAPDQAPADRSPWPMVLFAGVALMIAALLTRWILAPRAT
jgi:hypothetical protein